MKKIIIIGASGHGKVVADIAIDAGYTIVGFIDDNKKTHGRSICGVKVLGGIDICEKYNAECEFIIAIGNNKIRKKISEKYDLRWSTLTHSSACIGTDVEIKEGTVIMPNVVINASTRIGRHCIINSGAVVEHDSVIGDYVHISPGAALGGTVTVGDESHVGIGVCVRNNLNISSKCILGAGTVVVKNIVEEGVYVGCPADKLF